MSNSMAVMNEIISGRIAVGDKIQFSRLLTGCSNDVQQKCLEARISAKYDIGHGANFRELDHIDRVAKFNNKPYYDFYVQRLH